MREHDLYIPRAIVREVWGNIREAETKETFIQALPSEQTIPQSWHRVTEQQYEEAYSYVISLTGHLATTGQTVERYVTIESPEQMTVGDIQTAAISFAAMYEFAIISEAPTITVLKAQYQPAKALSV